MHVAPKSLTVYLLEVENLILLYVDQMFFWKQLCAAQQRPDQ